mgnify:CR=1 FL=1
MYKQIAEYIKEKIAHGEWPVGSKIPTQRALAEAFQVNRSTVTLALEELVAEGLLEGKTGSGTKVINNTWSLLAATPDWNSYVQSGVYQSNLPIIQEINRSEFNPAVIRLGTGELSPELFPKEMMKTVMEKLPERITSLGYEEPKGQFFLRQEISKYLKTMGIDASPASILIVSGALQALHLISVGLLKPNSTIFLEKPSYLYSLHVFQSVGVRLLGLPLDGEGLSVEALSQQQKQKKGALLYTIPSFHNPTGIVMSKSRRQELIKVCEEDRLPIIEDDVYRELWLDAPSPPPLKSLDQNGLVLYLGSMSKTLSPGLRIGWLVGPEPVIERLADLKMQTDYGSSSLSQWAAAEWLASGLYTKHLGEVREQLRVRRGVLLGALEDYFSELATWNQPQGGFYIWLRLNQPVAMQEIFKKALEKGTLLNPGNIYDRLSNQYLRLSYAYSSLEQLSSGIASLADTVKKLSPINL